MKVRYHKDTLSRSLRLSKNPRTYRRHLVPRKPPCLTRPPQFRRFSRRNLWLNRCESDLISLPHPRICSTLTLKILRCHEEPGWISREVTLTRWCHLEFLIVMQLNHRRPSASEVNFGRKQ